VIYGHSDNIHAPLSNEKQLSLLFDNACSLDPVDFASTYEDAHLVPNLLTECATAHGGLLKQGWFAAYSVLADQMQTLLQPEYNKVFQHLLTGGAPLHSAAFVEQARVMFAGIYDLFFHYVSHLTR